MKTVMGIFPTMQQADAAYADLLAEGFDRGRISAISKDTNVVKTEEKGAIQNAVGGGATGATAGAAVGGLTGVLLAAGTLAIPGVGALLIGGPLLAALGITGAAATVASSAMTGAAAGGVLGALTGLGLPEESAKTYSTRISEGGVVLSVEADDEHIAHAEEVLSKNNAEGVIAVSGRQ
jgi:hypothetical protein